MDQQQKERVHIAVVQGMILVGVLKGPQLMFKPRVLSVINNGKEIQLAPLPGIPGSITINGSSIMYAVPDHDKNIEKLYFKVTAPEVDPN